jgi:hypothetical protein
MGFVGRRVPLLRGQGCLGVRIREFWVASSLLLYIYLVFGGGFYRYFGGLAWPNLEDTVRYLELNTHAYAFESVP